MHTPAHFSTHYFAYATSIGRVIATHHAFSFNAPRA